MPLLKIAKLGNPVIRGGTTAVAEAEITSAAIQLLIDSMIDTMRDADGVGIAATQVYTARKICLIEVSKHNPRYPGQAEVPLTVLINPEIRSHSKETEDGWEGCLSIPDLRGLVPRFKSVEVVGVDRAGKPIKLNAEGFFARVIQHEIDHLNGVVFIDRMKGLSTLTYLSEYQRHWLK